MYYQVRGPPEAKGDEWWWPLVRRGISENSSEKAAGDAQWKPSGRRLGILQDRRTDEEKAQLLMTFEQWRDRRASLRGGADLRLPKPWAQQVEDEVKSGAARGKPATECTVNGELNQKVALVHGGVLDVTLDAIVNAANTGCLGGGGVDYAVHRGAGELLVVECASFNGCSTGQTRLTKGYNLPSDFVLHTVGPMDEDARALKSCYLTCLELAEEHQLTSLGFCMVSTGIFGYPLGAACHVALKTTRDWLEAHPTSCITCVAFCCYLDREYDCYRRLLPVYFPTTHDVQPKDVQAEDVQPKDVQPTDVQPVDEQHKDAQPKDVQPEDVQPEDVQPKALADPASTEEVVETSQDEAGVPANGSTAGEPSHLPEKSLV